MRFFKPPEDAPEHAQETPAEAAPAGRAVETDQPTTAHEEVKPVSNVQETLTKVMENIQGAIGAALVDFDGGLTLGTVGGGDELDLDTAGEGAWRWYAPRCGPWSRWASTTGSRTS